MVHIFVAILLSEHSCSIIQNHIKSQTPSSTSTFINYGTDTTGFGRLFPGIRSKPCTLDFHFIIPFFRELPLNWGFASCSSASIKNMMNASNNPNHPANRDGFTSNAAVLVVGGAAESLHCRPNNFQLVLKKRKGFCKIALETGASLVPVLHFGELDLFDQPPNPPGSPLRNFQEWIKNTTGIAPAAFRGVGFLQNTYGIIPRPKPLNAVSKYYLTSNKFRIRTNVLFSWTPD